MELLLSRTLDPADCVPLETELAIVSHTGLPPHRLWEQALALHAVERWRIARGLGEGNYYDARISSTAVQCGGGTMMVDVVRALSVIEYSPDPEALLYQLSCLLAPGGLLVLTMAYWNRCGQDTAHGHETRQRIYCPKLYSQLRQQAQQLQLTAFGGVDPLYHGPQVHDYSIASLVLEKRR